MKHKPFLCGWCATGNHEGCPGTITNGDGSHIRCNCSTTPKCGRVRCTQCFEDNPEHLTADGSCIDLSRCESRREMSVKIVRSQMHLPPIVTVQSRSAHLKEYDTMSENAAEKAPRKKSSNVPEKGINFLAEQVQAKTGKDASPASLRVLLRKLAADGTIERGEGRWSFTGVKDPAVLAVIKAVKEGGLEKAKKDGLEKAKESKERKQSKPSQRKPGRNKPAPVEDEDVPEAEDEDLPEVDVEPEDEEIDLDELIED